MSRVTDEILDKVIWELQVKANKLDFLTKELSKLELDLDIVDKQEIAFTFEFITNTGDEIQIYTSNPKTFVDIFSRGLKAIEEENKELFEELKL